MQAASADDSADQAEAGPQGATEAAVDSASDAPPESRGEFGSCTGTHASRDGMLARARHDEPLPAAVPCTLGSHRHRPARRKRAAASYATGDYADRTFGDAIAASRRQLDREHGGGQFSQVMLNLAEVQIRDGRDGYRWDGEGWFGGDRDRLVIKSEGRGGFGGDVDDAEVQALYSRAIGPYFNLQAGVRHDVRPKPSCTHLALGIEGLPPYWFEVEASAFLSDRGDVSGRIEAYYDQRITQRLILQPRVEVNLAAQDDRAREIGGGISDLELGLRLRYELAREFAPYVGVSWDRRLGDTARFARAAGDGASEVSMVAGVRFWF